MEMQDLTSEPVEGTEAATSESKLSYVKLAMRNMVRKRGTS